jgi:hypothetical protein
MPHTIGNNLKRLRQKMKQFIKKIFLLSTILIVLFVGWVILSYFYPRTLGAITVFISNKSNIPLEIISVSVGSTAWTFNKKIEPLATFVKPYSEFPPLNKSHECEVKAVFNNQEHLFKCECENMNISGNVQGNIFIYLDQDKNLYCK